jgi:carboxypeptidase C (cathepsin A)
LNWTQSIDSAYFASNNIGDYARRDVRGYLEDMAYILESGIKVALVFGDRDYACNWVGGEEVSLAVSYAGSDQFRSAGYADIQTNSHYVGGAVRQYGNFSFSRIYGRDLTEVTRQIQTNL